MSRRSGIVTTAILNQARKHERLERFIKQGTGRANLRSAKFAVDQKSRAILSRYNMGGTKFSGVNKVKSRFRLVGRGEQIRERITSSAGIPLRDFGARQTNSGVTFSVRRGVRSMIRSAFKVSAYGGNVFTRVGRARGPIKQRYGPGLATMADNQTVRLRGNEAYHTRAEREIRNEENRAFKRAKL